MYCHTYPACRRAPRRRDRAPRLAAHTGVCAEEPAAAPLPPSVQGPVARPAARTGSPAVINDMSGVACCHLMQVRSHHRPSMTASKCTPAFAQIVTDIY